MTLRLERVLPDLEAVVRGYARGQEAARAGVDAAESALSRWAASPTADAQIAAAMADNPRPFALSWNETVTATFAPAPRPPVTVVAADGSSIAPDRFAPVPAYVINTGLVSLPYGTPGAPLLDTEVEVGPRELLAASEDDGSETVEARGFGVELLRDVLELERGQDLAAAAIEHGETVLLLDGTLLPWDLDARTLAETVRRDALRRTDGALARMRDLGPRLSVGAYVSSSRATEVTTSLEALSGAGGAVLSRGDAALFRRLLADGERSAVFLSQSRRGEQVERLLAQHPVVFFYVRIGGDLARVEMPRWAASPAQVERLHATIIDQAERCKGYPRALQEAHELAVINGPDRAAFARLLERLALRESLTPLVGGKQESKRRRAI